MQTREMEIDVKRIYCCTECFTFVANPGTLATGDCKKDIHIWRPGSGSSFSVSTNPLVGHSRSVEDLQWSPTDTNVSTAIAGFHIY